MTKKKIKDIFDKLNKSKNSDTSNQLFSFRRVIIAVIGIIATVIIQRSVVHFLETNLPHVYFKVIVDERYPQAHMLSDPVNEVIYATLDLEMPMALTLENDNETPIYIEGISLVVDRYDEIPRDSFLLIKDYFAQGEKDVISLDALKKINSFQKKYPLSIVDNETKEELVDKYLQLESGMTDRYCINVDFDQEGLYTLHFNVDYRIHGKTQTEETEECRILHIHRNTDTIKNPDNSELKTKLISSYKNEYMDYSIYGDGTIVLKNVIDGSLLYQNNEYLLKRLIVDEGVQSIDAGFTSIAGPNVKEIHLPSTLRSISDNTFVDYVFNARNVSIESGSNVSSPLDKTIFYNGTYSEWMERVDVGNNNDLLYCFEFEFSDGYKGYINSNTQEPVQDSIPITYTTTELKLIELARDYFERYEGYIPAYTDIANNGNGTYTIHLYDMTEDLVSTAAWYTVDENGIGTDDILLININLNE